MTEEEFSPEQLSALEKIEKLFRLAAKNTSPEEAATATAKAQELLTLYNLDSDSVGKHVTVLPVMVGHNKGLFMHAEGDILIDDFITNVDAWRNLNGVGILHTYSAWDLTYYELKRALVARVPGIIL